VTVIARYSLVVERLPDAGAAGTWWAWPVRMTLLGRGSDGDQLG
jgi:hypothetical protein